MIYNKTMNTIVLVKILLKENLKQRVKDIYDITDNEIDNIIDDKISVDRIKDPKL